MVLSVGFCQIYKNCFLTCNIFFLKKNNNKYSSLKKKFTNRNEFEGHFFNVCQYLNQQTVFKSWKNGFFRDSKQNVIMSLLMPFGMKNVIENPNEDPLFQFFLLFNQTWTLENSPKFTEEILETFASIERRFLFF